MPAIIGHNLQHKGDWSGIVQYYPDNMVRSGGSTYICILSNLNQAPPNATYWELVAEKGDTGAAGADGADGTDGADGADGVVASIVAGTGITVDSTDPANPIVSASGGGGGSIGGSSGSTDNALIRADGAGGSTIQGNGGLATLSDAGELAIDKGTITASLPHVLSETWNSGGVTFVGVDINVTDTASAVASRVLRIRVGGTVIATVSKTQLISAIGSVVAGNAPGLSFEGFSDTGFGVNGDNIAIWESNRIALNLSTLNREFRIPSDFRFAFSSATNNNSAADTFLRRVSAAVVGLGIDASTPVNQRIKAPDGSGTDRPGANLSISAGSPTGTGTPGNLIFQVAASAGSSGSGVQTAGDRFILSTVGEAAKLNIASAGLKGLALKLAASATANPFEIRDSTEAVLASMDTRGAYIAPASTTAGASARLPHGTAPTSPVDGDLWSTTAGFYGRANGSTVGPFGAGGGGISDGATLATGLTFPVAGLHILDTNASHDLILSPGSDLTADRTLTITTGDADRTLTLTASASISGTNTGDQDLSGYALTSGLGALAFLSSLGPADVGADPAGTDNSTDVTLAGTPTYITIAGQVITRNAIINADIDAAATVLSRVIGLVIDGGGSAITTGIKGYIRVPFACTVTGWSLLADVSGSIVIDVWKDTYANYPPDVADTIAGTEKPTLSSAVKNEDTSLTTWTTSLSAGDVIGFNVDSAATVTRVQLSLNVRLT